jgi:hypothetical protein
MRQLVSLDAVGNVTLGVDEEATRQTNDALILAAAGGGRQFGNGSIRDVDANDGKIAIRKFPNVGASVTRNASSAVLMRIRAYSAQKHDTLLTIVRTIVKPILRCPLKKNAPHCVELLRINLRCTRFAHQTRNHGVFAFRMEENCDSVLWNGRHHVPHEVRIGSRMPTRKFAADGDDRKMKHLFVPKVFPEIWDGNERIVAKLG